jgi:hypothetical protein
MAKISAFCKTLMASAFFPLGLAVAILCPWRAIWASSHQPLDFSQLMMSPSASLSAKDVEELRAMEKDYNRDIEYLCKPPLRSVPKIIHFIWIGPRPFPKNSIENLKSWRRYHKKWDIYFWTDSKDRPLPMPEMQRKLIQEFDFGPFTDLIASTDSWAEKADLIRYMILYKMGGIYSDHDVEALRSLSPFAESFDFVAGLEWFNYHPGMDSCVSPCNAIIISRKKHPIMGATIDRVVQCWDEIAVRFPGKDSSGVLQRVIARTFDSFALSVKKYRNQQGYRDVVLPNTYFYPYPAFDTAAVEQFRQEGYVYAIHKYAGSWVK